MLNIFKTTGFHEKQLSKYLQGNRQMDTFVMPI